MFYYLYIRGSVREDIQKRSGRLDVRGKLARLLAAATHRGSGLSVSQG